MELIEPTFILFCYFLYFVVHFRMHYKYMEKY